LPLSPARTSRVQGQLSPAYESYRGDWDRHVSLFDQWSAHFQGDRHLEGKGRDGISSQPWYAYDMKNVLTISEFARLGGKARAAKLTKEQLSAIGKKGGRPRKKLDNTQETTPNA
jgi:hypothetical protein